MKNVFLSLAFAFAALPPAQGQTAVLEADSALGEMDGSDVSPDDPFSSSVGGGGSGGTPRTSSIGTNSVRIPSVDRPSTVLMARENMLKAIDAALNGRDLRMNVEHNSATIRLQSMDLNAGILRGRILETNQAVQLLDRSKAVAPLNHRPVAP